MRREVSARCGRYFATSPHTSELTELALSLGSSTVKKPRQGETITCAASSHAGAAGRTCNGPRKMCSSLQ
eukprot:scaffold100050_cov72-Phaeocystis_antarctica.AAC.5